MKVAAKYLAYQLPNRQTPKLDDFYLSLVDNNRSKCRLLKTRADKEAETGTAREICEVFIKSWASQRPKNENKVSRHHYPNCRVKPDRNCFLIVVNLNSNIRQ